MRIYMYIAVQLPAYLQLLCNSCKVQYCCRSLLMPVLHAGLHGDLPLRRHRHLQSHHGRVSWLNFGTPRIFRFHRGT